MERLRHTDVSNSHPCKPARDHIMDNVLHRLPVIIGRRADPAPRLCSRFDLDFLSCRQIVAADIA